MTNGLLERILATLEQRSPLRPQGKGWQTRCPHPSHPDRHPSFFLYPSGAGRCFSQCDSYWSPQELAELLGLEIPPSNEGLTRQQLATAKGLLEGVLHSWGVKDGVSGSGPDRRPCVDIPYVNTAGDIVALHKRLSLHGSPRFIWRRGDHPILYGLARLSDIRKAGRVILVEGESDTWTLWHQQ